MWNFEHAPRKHQLAMRYQIHYTQPAVCADELLSGRADLGLIPIAALTPEMAIVPGCAIASLDRVRSIQLIVKGAEAGDHALRKVGSVAADTASRSSLAYAQVLFRRFVGVDPKFLPAIADPIAMLSTADAALLIGDPALLALERRQQIEAKVGPCIWIDLAHEWRTRTGLPWVAAVWAARPEGLREAGADMNSVTRDLQESRDAGLAHTEDLVGEWALRIALPPATIREYLTRNIHYTLEPECLEAIRVFRCYAAEIGVLGSLETLRFA